MTIITDFIQVGVSNTATQNFTLKTNNDGTAKLARGNFDATTQDVLTVNSGGVVDFPQGATIGGSAGQKMLLTASQDTVSGTFVDFMGIPSWAKRITVLISDLSTNGTSIPQIQLGTSGGIQTSGYTNGLSVLSTTAGIVTSTTAFQISGVAASSVVTGEMRLTKQQGNTWICGGEFYRTTESITNSTVGGVTLSGVLDRIRLTTINGTDTFDAGSVSLLIEGY